MAVAILIDLQDVSLDGAERELLEGLSLTVSSGDRIGVVGINGAGKSSLLKIVAGLMEPSAGSIRRGQSTSVGFLAQIPTLPAGTVRDAVGSGWQRDAALDRLGMLSEVDTDTEHLSGGQSKRVALASLFAEPADVLILDEPTNLLDLRAIEWLEQQIISFRGAIVLVSHDRFLLDQVTTRMVEIDRGKTYVHAGGYSKLLEAQAEREQQAASAEQTRKNLARTELAWLRRGVKARSTKPQARIDAAERLLAARPEAAAREGALELGVEMPRLGTTVIKVHHGGFSYPGGSAILADVHLDLAPGERLGIVGPNGAGKSTLLDLLAGTIEPTVGTVKRGPTVVTSYFEQDGGELDLDRTVQELVAGPQGIPGSPSDVALMKRFWFGGALPFSKASELSGGERRRLQLLLALAVRPNVLFLDEPTNDLDLETIRLLEAFLSRWSGTVVVASHDRTFLSRTTERLVEVHADGTLSDIPGGIDAWIARSSGVLAATSSSSDVSGTAAKGPGVGTRSRQLRETEKEMTRLERRSVTLTNKIMASADHVEQRALDLELKAVRGELAAAEDRWLSLAE
jgi:ATP-binding cassette subfamily F protein uup